MRTYLDRKLYFKLIEDQKKLRALEAAGVDNWEGYSYAMEILNAEHNGEKDADKKP